jgi:TolB protein
VLAWIGVLALGGCTPIADSRTPTPPAAPVAAANPTEAACGPTTAEIPGPNYVWNAPARASVGQGHVLSGTVRSGAGCAPIAGAKLEFWLASPDGQYDEEHRATVSADAEGAYRFESNFPGSYPERPLPHIHLFVSAPGHRSVTTEYHPPSGETAGTFDIVLAPTETSGMLGVEERPLASNSGQLAFHSDRSGNMDIYTVAADGSAVSNLTNDPANDMFPTWSPDGRQLAFVSDREGNPDLYSMNADGSGIQNLTDHPDEDLDHAWSPDGSRLAFASNRDGDWELYLLDLPSGEITQLTNNRGDDWSPAWSPDGTQLVFSSDADIWTVNTDGSNLANLTRHRAEDDFPAWSPDGTQIAISSTRDGNWELYVMQVDGSQLQRLTDLPSEESYPAWSPEGTRLAFKSDRDGNYEIYLMNADGTGVTRVTDEPAGDGFPAWRPLTETTCVPTPGQRIAEQPIPDPALPAHLALADEVEPGERLVFSGTVYAADCMTPLAGALLELWQANAAGEYTDLEGMLMTDDSGHYRIDTIMPGLYGAPAHIHARIYHPRGRAIETELVFEGDPNLPPDTSGFAIIPLGHGEGAAGSGLHGRWDIVLQGNE